jgi:hypothetical protein
MGLDILAPGCAVPLDASSQSPGVLVGTVFLSIVTRGKIMRVERQTVDLSAYPNLVVIYLGMRVRRPRGLARLLGLGPQIQKSWKAQPDGLLLHEDLIWSLVPPHLGMRQYWRDLDSLERWTRSEPHRRWWQQFLRDSGGTGFWHETYFMGGGVDAIYDDMAAPTGLARFAPARPARGAMYSARHRAGREGPLTVAPVIPEQMHYGAVDAADLSAPDGVTAD